MIEATQRKLREARFFYRQLVAEGDKTITSEPEAFFYFLSAFLSAGRSVTWVLQTEEKNKYDAWFPQWKRTRSDDERKLLVDMNDQRVAEVHKDGAETSVARLFIPVTEIRIDTRGHPAYGIHWFGPPDAAAPEVERRTAFFELGHSKAEVTETGGRYLNLLETCIAQFTEAHP